LNEAGIIDEFFVSYDPLTFDYCQIYEISGEEQQLSYLFETITDASSVLTITPSKTFENPEKYLFELRCLVSEVPVSSSNEIISFLWK
jgi:hypothetical protein